MRVLGNKFVVESARRPHLGCGLLEREDRRDAGFWREKMEEKANRVVRVKLSCK